MPDPVEKLDPKEVSLLNKALRQAGGTYYKDFKAEWEKHRQEALKTGVRMSVKMSQRIVGFRYRHLLNGGGVESIPGRIDDIPPPFKPPPKKRPAETERVSVHGAGLEDSRNASPEEIIDRITWDVDESIKSNLYEDLCWCLDVVGKIRAGQITSRSTLRISSFKVISLLYIAVTDYKSFMNTYLQISRKMIDVELDEEGSKEHAKSTVKDINRRLDMLSRYKGAEDGRDTADGEVVAAW